MAVSVLDDRNAPVIGVKADLVCTEPFPSAPLTFEGEDGDARYRAAYFAERDDIWTHGDLAEITERATVIVHGRSDTTLKPSGVRIGTAEIYRVLDARDDIVDSIVFGRAENNNEDVVLCVVLPDGRQLTDELAASIRADIRTQTSPRHVPRYVFAVQAVPYTFNGKKVEGAVKAISAGKAVENVASLSNPECLAEYAGLFT
jgi:acetoacetyl-CoA synthetase